MIYKTTGLVLSLICLLTHIAVGQNLRWVNSMGGNNAGIANATVVDNAGNTYVVGNFMETVDFDPGPAVASLTSLGSSDIFIAKYGPDGQYLWAKNIGGSAAENGRCLTLDPTGNIYFAGNFNGTVDLDAGPGVANFTSNGGPDIFFTKYDPNGSYLWAKTIGGPLNQLSTEMANAITTDGSGNVYLTGIFVGTATNFNPGAGSAILSARSGDIFFAKYDGNGNYIWAKGIGGTNIAYQDMGYALSVDTTGNVFLASCFVGTTVDYDPGPNVANLTGGANRNLAISKYDVMGNYLWAKSIWGKGSAIAAGLRLDAAGNIYIAGTLTGGACDFDPGTNVDTLSAIKDNIFIAKYTNSGAYLWAKKMGSSDYLSNAYGMSLDTATGTLYITGGFIGTIDLDAGPDSVKYTAKGGSDIFVAKYDKNSKHLWSTSMGGTGADNGNGIAIDNANIYLAGTFSGSATFGPSFFTEQRTSVDSTDAFLLRIKGCSQVVQLGETACKNYTFNKKNYTKSGTYVETFNDAFSCDSIVVLQLTILDTVKHTIADTACDSYSFNGRTYTESGTYTRALTSTRGCDSILTLNLTIRKPTNTIMPFTHYCDSVIIDGHTYTSSGKYTHSYKSTMGCDSIIVYDLSIGYPNSNKIVHTVCERFEINDTFFTTSGVYDLGIFKNSSGCDSTVTLDLTIYPSPETSLVKDGALLSAGIADQYQWIICGPNALVPISGATAQTYMASDPGWYAVILTSDQGCTDTSKCVQVDQFTEIESINNKGRISRAYPNPVHNLLHISTTYPIPGAVLSLISITGQKLMQWHKVDKKNSTVDLTTLTAGIYFLVLEGSGHIERFKIIKD